MTKRTRLTNKRLSYRKRAAAPKVKSWLTFVQNSSVVNLSLIALIIVMGFSYLGIVNSTAADTVRLHALTSSVEEQKDSNNKLELSITEVQSLQHISDMSERYDLVVATDVEYIETDTAVALNQ